MNVTVEMGSILYQAESCWKAATSALLKQKQDQQLMDLYKILQTILSHPAFPPLLSQFPES